MIYLKMAGTYLVPSSLAAATTGKGFKGRLGERVLGENLVTRELVDTLGGVLVESLLVEQNIPDTGGAVLRITVTLDVGVVLLRSCVRTDESNKIIRADGLVLEQVDESESIRGDFG